MEDENPLNEDLHLRPINTSNEGSHDEYHISEAFYNLVRCTSRLININWEEF